MNSRRWQNLHFSKGVTPQFLEKNLKDYYPSFLGQMSQKKCQWTFYNIANTLSKIVKRFQTLHFCRGVSPWFLVKNLKFFLSFLFWPNEPIKVLLNVLYRKRIFYNGKNMNLRRLQNLHLSKGVSPWYFVKNLKFPHFFFLFRWAKKICLWTLYSKKPDGKICIFPKGLVHGFLSKILNFLIPFLDKTNQDKVFMMEKDPF